MFIRPDLLITSIDFQSGQILRQQSQLDSSGPTPERAGIAGPGPACSSSAGTPGSQFLPPPSKNENLSIFTKLRRTTSSYQDV